MWRSRSSPTRRRSPSKARRTCWRSSGQHRDGLILESARRRGTFLPKVWEGLETPEKFLNGLKVKAGLPRDHWASDLKIWRYTTETFGAPVPQELFRRAA
ncbi:MAG: AMMECR1 domain-containing protein [Minwuia sp.]|uniref:AMMECR1 domain-containing protein n=1 Tax=Minwuia sp. TaxID=2493630 RepID=UPI003A879868